MAKKNGLSVHSRAARRATSPGIDTDKSLKNARPPAEPLGARPSVLAVHASAGVAKRAHKGGRKAVPSARARRRQERGAELAAAVAERTAAKVQKSKGQARAAQGRRRAWEEINAGVAAGPGAAAAEGGNKFAGLAGSDEDEGEEGAGGADEEVQGGAAEEGGRPAATQPQQEEEQWEDEEEIL